MKTERRTKEEKILRTKGEKEEGKKTMRNLLLNIN